MNKFKDLTNKQKIWLISFLIFVGLLLLFLIALHEYSAIVSETQQRALSLMSVTSASKGEKVERLFQIHRNQLRLLSRDPMILEGFENLKKAFDTLLPPNPEIEKKETVIRAEKMVHYLYQELIPALIVIRGDPVDINSLLSLNWRTLTLQDYYVINNTEVGLARSSFNMAEDGSEYSSVHKLIQPTMRDHLINTGVEDILMVDTEGNVIYSVEKEVDFATNLFNGPLKDTLFNSVVKSSLKKPDTVHTNPELVDLSLYFPAAMKARAFLAMPMFKEEKIIGVLVFKIGTAKINQITFGDWGREESKGMGKTGEVFLIGGDYKFRSNSRFIVQEPEEYFLNCAKAGIPLERIEKMRFLRTTTLLQEYKSDVVKKSFFSAGAAEGINYLKEPSLIGFAPIDIEEVQWGIIAEISKAEVLGPIHTIRNQFMMSGGIILFFLFLFSLLLISSINRQQLQKELEKKVEERTEELKETQNQLFQKEKMAFLGLITTGIAHEIENPLNFIINFSDLSSEMITELEQSIQASTDQQEDFSKLEEPLMILKNNINLIHKHGKKADLIVKRMLEHSFGGPGTFEFKNIHHLINEAISLAYAKIKSYSQDFDVTLEKHFDPHVKYVEISAQDFQQVLLNILDNAYYSLYKKKKAIGESFIPIISITTLKLDQKLEVHIRDNGEGIWPGYTNKIFTPFFTTKPTGSGAGLGLSLSHSIIVQQHGGELTFHTKEGEYTEFIIVLTRPMKEI